MPALRGDAPRTSAAEPGGHHDLHDASPPHEADPSDAAAEASADGSTSARRPPPAADDEVASPPACAEPFESGGAAEKDPRSGVATTASESADDVSAAAEPVCSPFIFSAAELEAHRAVGRRVAEEKRAERERDVLEQVRRQLAGGALEGEAVEGEAVEALVRRVMREERRRLRQEAHLSPDKPSPQKFGASLSDDARGALHSAARRTLGECAAAATSESSCSDAASGAKSRKPRPLAFSREPVCRGAGGRWQVAEAPPAQPDPPGTGDVPVDPYRLPPRAASPRQLDAASEGGGGGGPCSVRGSAPRGSSGRRPQTGWPKMGGSRERPPSLLRRGPPERADRADRAERAAPAGFAKLAAAAASSPSASGLPAAYEAFVQAAARAGVTKGAHQDVAEKVQTVRCDHRAKRVHHAAGGSDDRTVGGGDDSAAAGGNERTAEGKTAEGKTAEGASRIDLQLDGWLFRLGGTVSPQVDGTVTLQGGRSQPGEPVRGAAHAPAGQPVGRGRGRGKGRGTPAKGQPGKGKGKGKGKGHPGAAPHRHVGAGAPHPTSSSRLAGRGAATRRDSDDAYREDEFTA